MSAPSVRHWFDPDPEVVYLDAGTYGLPPRPAIQASMDALRRWQTGTADFARDWEPAGERSRELFAQLIGAAVETIALIPTASVGVGMVAASLPAGAEVLLPQEEFTSVVVPFYAAVEGRGITVREVPYGELANEIRPGTTLVAFSLTRAQSGETAELGPILAAARRHGTQVLVDATQALPFVPVKEHLDGIDYLVCHGYKHLLLPRGVGFLYIKPERWDANLPYLANWRSVGRAYGGPLTLAPRASRFDVTLAWHAWVGAAPALELLVAWNRDGTLLAAKELANRLARGLGLPAPGASLVCVKIQDPERATDVLRTAGIKCASRGGNIRLTPHVYNTEAEIDQAIAAVREALRVD
jgi:selenocysteine lyase/cysteine desulfurase